MDKPDDTDMDNIAAFPDKAAIKEEAGAWIVRIDQRKLDDAEVRALREWVRRSDFHRDYLFKLAANWDAMGMLGELAELFPLPESEPRHSHPASARSRLWARLKDAFRFPVLPVSAAVASVLLAVFVFASIPWFGGPERAREYTTAVGERGSYVLEDGTTLALNTNSRIRVDYTSARRIVTLMRGEANFDVARNPERPFVVYAGGGMVWALGTAFNVRHIDDAIDVIVTEGRVKIFSDTRAVATEAQIRTDIPPTDLSDPASAPPAANSATIDTVVDRDKEAFLDAGQAIRYSRVIQFLQPIRKEELARKLAWQRGALIFKGETLMQAVAEIARYTDKEIVIVDPDLSKLRVGGHYKTDDIDALLITLGEGLGINVLQTADNRILLSAGSITTKE